MYVCVCVCVCVHVCLLWRGGGEEGGKNLMHMVDDNIHTLDSREDLPVSVCV